MLTPRKLILLATMGTILALSVAVVAIYDKLRHDDHGGLEATVPAEVLPDIAPAAGQPPEDSAGQPPEDSAGPPEDSAGPPENQNKQRPAPARQPD